MTKDSPIKSLSKADKELIVEVAGRENLFDMMKTMNKKTLDKLKKKTGYDKGLTGHSSGGLKKGGRVRKRNTRRMNRLEELGRVDAEKAFTKRGKRNLKAEKKRIVRELKSSGGSAGVALRGKGCEIR